MYRMIGRMRQKAQEIHDQMIEEATMIADDLTRLEQFYDPLLRTRYSIMNARADELTMQLREFRQIDRDFPSFNRADVEHKTERDMKFLHFARKYSLPSLPPVLDNEPASGRLF